MLVPVIDECREWCLAESPVRHDDEAPDAGKQTRIADGSDQRAMKRASGLESPPPVTRRRAPKVTQKTQTLRNRPGVHVLLHDTETVSRDDKDQQMIGGKEVLEQRLVAIERGADRRRARRFGAEQRRIARTLLREANRECFVLAAGGGQL